MKDRSNNGWRHIFKAPADVPAASTTWRVDVRDIRIVKWGDLPTWVKGAYSAESQMLTLMSMTWAVTPDGNTYFAYGSDGRYVASFAKE